MVTHENSNIVITGEKFQCLRPTGWLNDEVNLFADYLFIPLLFELALAAVDEQHPERWEVVAAMVGGEKSAGDVQEHYVILLEDLLVIESGKLDNTLGEVMPVVLVECKESMCLSHDDTSS